MTEQTISPLHEAQALVGQLQSNVSALDPAELKQQLDRLSDLLHQAAQHGEGADAAQIRIELDKMIEETAAFSSMMVHEIRKPMTSIRGYADMLAKPGMIGPLNDMQTQFVGTIRNNIIRMEGLVSDISDISKLNSGRLRLDNKMTTFGQIIMDVQKQAESLIAEYEHQVTWTIPQGLPILTTDAKQLAKVIFNLLRNAIQYTPKGTGQIVVKAERLENNVLHVTVTDNGIGMKPEEIARLGELFYRADHELVTSEKGYGLGIPIAMGFLKVLGSQLEIQSEPEKGSTFGFQLAGMG